MDTRQVLASYMDILIRIPALFLLDEVFQSRIAYLGIYPCTLLPLHKESDFDDVTGESYHTLLYEAHHSLVDMYNSSMFPKLNQNAINVIEFNVSTTLSNFLDVGLEGCNGSCGLLLQIITLFTASCVSMFALTLWTQHLIKLYSFLLSISMVVLSRNLNLKVFNHLSSASSTASFGAILNLDGTAFDALTALTVLTDVVGNLALQIFLAIAYLFFCQYPPINNSWLQGTLGLCFLLPSFTTLLPMDTVIQRCYYLLVAHYISVGLMNYNLVCKVVNGQIAHIIWGIRNDGILAFFESEWLRLNIPLIFRSFWLMRCGIHIYIYLASSELAWTDVESLKTLLKIVMVRGCETLPALLGMASVFSCICAKVYIKSQEFMQIPGERSTHIGPLAATLFVIFSFQYGLSTLKPASRIVRLMRILVLITTCFLHFTYTSVDTVLMSLAASANLDFKRHARALLVSGSLTLALLSGLYVLWTTHSISTWLLAVSGFSVEALCKIAISLALYIVFLVDARHQELWDKLDDHVYRIKFVGRVIEYVIGLVMMINSGIALILESGGTCRAILFGLHGYFNLSFFWDEALRGWEIYQKRRIAVCKIATLQSVEEHMEIDDVCAICFNHLKNNRGNKVLIKVTPCRHYYHAVCLRKWLYVQDRCPMCHQTLWPELSPSHDDSDPSENSSID
ncbi:protein TRC8 homolog [Daphnia pulex]|uniref:protein TRC8 homolog n=1 Tax=Daphnia pulex TaxID=6669 RepID=UPI001EDD2DC0|nr:protein TRC8 homolog [Daphnia pulex]